MIKDRQGLTQRSAPGQRLAFAARDRAPEVSRDTPRQRSANLAVDGDYSVARLPGCFVRCHMHRFQVFYKLHDVHLAASNAAPRIGPAGQIKEVACHLDAQVGEGINYGVV